MFFFLDIDIDMPIAFTVMSQFDKKQTKTPNATGFSLGQFLSLNVEKQC